MQTPNSPIQICVTPILVRTTRGEGTHLVPVFVGTWEMSGDLDQTGTTVIYHNSKNRGSSRLRCKWVTERQLFVWSQNYVVKLFLSASVVHRIGMLNGLHALNGYGSIDAYRVSQLAHPQTDPPG